MTTYEVTAWCSVPHYTTFDVDAGSVEEALEKAKIQAKDEYGEPCDGAECDWDEFEIASEGDADEYIRHLEPSRSAKNTAPELPATLWMTALLPRSIRTSVTAASMLTLPEMARRWSWLLVFAMSTSWSVVKRVEFVKIGPAIPISECLAKLSVTSIGAFATGASRSLISASVLASILSIS